MIKKILSIFAFSLFALIPKLSQAQISNVATDAEARGIICNVGNVICLSTLDITKAIYYNYVPDYCKVAQYRWCSPDSSGKIVYSNKSIDTVQYMLDAYIALMANNQGDGSSRYESYDNCVDNVNYNFTTTTCRVKIWRWQVGNTYFYEYGYYTGFYMGAVNCPGETSYIPGEGCLTENSVRPPVSEPSDCDECATGDSALAAANASPKVGNPVDINTGAKTESKMDLDFPIPFKRSYISTRQSAGSMGISWTHNYDKKLSIYYDDLSLQTPLKLTFKLENNEDVIFTRANASANFAPLFKDHKGYSVSIVSRADGGKNYVLNTPSGNKETYYAHLTNGLAWLTQIEYKNGIRYNFYYNAQQQLNLIIDSYSHYLTFIYSDYANAIVQVASSNGDYMQYSYWDGYLVEARFNNSETIGYTYNQGNLMSKIDAKGNTFALFEYDNKHRVIASKHISSPGNYVETYAYDYSTPNTVIATLPNNTQSTYGIQKSDYRYKTGSSSIGGATSTGLTYDATGKPSGFNDSLYQANYVFDPTTNLLTSSSYRGQTKTYNWDTAKRQITSYTDTNNAFSRTYSFLYDAAGNTIQKTINSSGNTRTSSSTYDYFGKLLTTTNPIGATTTIVYYPNNGSNSNINGLPYTITNGEGHITTINSYNNQGKPTSITLPDSRTKTMTYDLRGRLLTETLGGATNSYIYDANGQLTQTTLANGYVLNMTYDMAHRMTGMTDNRGNSMSYTFDANGNITNESESSGSTLVSVKNTIFDALGRVSQTSGASNSYPYNYTYDSLGRVLTVQNPNNQSQTMTYDAKDSVQSITGMDRDQTTNRDADGNLLSISQMGNINTFTYNGFGELLTATNADSGTTTYSHSISTRTKTKTDNGSNMTTWTYDKLGRPLTEGSGFLTSTYTWDTVKPGRLTSVSNPGIPTTSYTYNANSQLASKTQAGFGPNSKTVSYDYTPAGELSKITYPSGMQVEYMYDKGVITEVKVNSATIINQIQYRGFSSAPVAWNWGNSAARQVSIDANGRITGLSDASVMNRTYTQDNLGNITGINDTAIANNSLTATYNLSNQLTSYFPTTYIEPQQTITTTPTFNITGRSPYSFTVPQLTISLNGNRIQTANFGTTAIMIPGYDSRGNMTSDGAGSTYGYDTKGNMSTFSKTGAYSLYNNASYIYNYKNERIMKILVDTATMSFNPLEYTYNETGQLIGEYNSSGTPSAEHIYLGSTPIGVMKNGVLYYVHTDHLGTPRVITNNSGTAVWKWENSNAYGANLPNDNIGGMYFEYNLRFPGQYFDNESKLHYNKNRTYHPELGRYMQPDPIGINGGMNPYSYVENNPLNASDPEGLLAELSIKNGIMTIKMHAQIFGNNFNSVYDPEWLKGYNLGISNAWNSKNWSYGNCKVRFDINFTLSETNTPNKVIIHGGPLGKNDRSHSEWDFSTGQWFDKEWRNYVYADRTISKVHTFNYYDFVKQSVHETAHLMGVFDMYSEQTQQPRSGWEGTILGDPHYGEVNEKDVAMIVTNNLRRANKLDSCGC